MYHKLGVRGLRHHGVNLVQVKMGTGERSLLEYTDKHEDNP